MPGHDGQVGMTATDVATARSRARQGSPGGIGRTALHTRNFLVEVSRAHSYQLQERTH
jgi:hypothetical protein